MRACSEESSGAGKGSKNNNTWKLLKRLRMMSLGKAMLLGSSFLQICENLWHRMRHRCAFFLGFFFFLVCFGKKFEGDCSFWLDRKKNLANNSSRSTQDWAVFQCSELCHCWRCWTRNACSERETGHIVSETPFALTPCELSRGG